ncbi:MAG: response regulator [Pseudanabaenaceae cyanobacterium SKYGB_i_bin29]|nr:response regulator [Pseudanabaenaceae cyanobacterium SKYG29]MDW8422498.1 response regulator [Pseudanabaenaceae cyanobacterium SKYGB_i_bin29]
MRKILVVEDSLTEREQISLYLTNAGFTVRAVGSSEEAEAIIATDRPDAIVLDVILPGKSGFEFCRRIKNDPATANIPVVICSTKNTEVDKTWGRMGGANSYLTKPVEPELLITTVKQALNI